MNARRNTMKKYLCQILFALLLLSSLKCVSGFTGNVTAISNSMTAKLNSTVVLQWKLFNSLRMYLRMDKIRLLLYAVPNLVEPLIIVRYYRFGVVEILNASIEMFGNRISATYNGSMFTVLLNKVVYTDSHKYLLRVMDYYYRLQSTVTLNVTGGPDDCGDSLKSMYNVEEFEKLLVTKEICGHPKPTVRWKFQRNRFYSPSASSQLINNSTRLYRYSFEWRNITRANCGRKLLFSASGYGESLSENACH
ncbi:uncharacterized protein LOC130636323 isoform X1 [Hydractinia symbiolongicarpus]|uniref:uncharacterized protein LOC130636323 isoform X1 n=1 Tax=Hydractinia symbiolongicarpus TaxID=13093 RepID=UPI00254AEF9B|nr:uncharacterized protein LOC130636323 isoform X1 [Hydractinia symbiolongicarpus]